MSEGRGNSKPEAFDWKKCPQCGGSMDFFCDSSFCGYVCRKCKFKKGREKTKAHPLIEKILREILNGRG